MTQVKEIRIRGNNSQLLSITLKDILRCFEHPEKIFWRILWISATTTPESTISILDFEEMVNDSPNGVIMEWSELENLALSIDQTIEILFIGNHDLVNSRRHKVDEQMYEKCDYVVELVDSSYWEIHSSDDSFLERVRVTLDGVVYI